MSLVVYCSSFFFTATFKNEGRIKTAGGRAGEELGGQTAAEEPSAEPEGGTPEPAEHTHTAGQLDRKHTHTSVVKVHGPHVATIL